MLRCHPLFYCFWYARELGILGYVRRLLGFLNSIGVADELVVINHEILGCQDLGLVEEFLAVGRLDDIGPLLLKFLFFPILALALALDRDLRRSLPDA